MNGGVKKLNHFRIPLRFFLIVVTVCCLAFPPLVSRYLTYVPDSKLWADFHESKLKRDIALREYLTRNKSGVDVANAAEQYYSEAASVEECYDAIVDRYKLELDSKGTPLPNVDFERAFERYGK